VKLLIKNFPAKLVWLLAATCVFGAAISLSSCAIYEPITANFRDLRDSGIDGVRLDLAPSDHRDLGRVRVTERSFLFSACDEVGQRAIRNLAAQARSRGANVVSDVSFRGKWKWRKEPVCRRNFTWAVLIVPLFLPIPVTVDVIGYAGHDPAPIQPRR
jgi:hypothetical protein